MLNTKLISIIAAVVVVATLGGDKFQQARQAALTLRPGQPTAMSSMGLR